MAYNVACLNARGLRSASHAKHVLVDLLHLGVDVAVIEETHFIAAKDAHVLTNDFVVVSAYGDVTSRGVSLLVRASLRPVVDVVYADARGRLIVADVSISGQTFRVSGVYAPNCPKQRKDLFLVIDRFLGYQGHLVLMGDWNAILDPSIDRVGQGSRRVENSLVDFMDRNDLVDRYRIDHPGVEMWTWARSSSPIDNRSYIDRVLVRRADTDFISCPTFHGNLGYTDHKLVRARIRLTDRPSLAGYWKFNLSYLKRKDFRELLENFVRGWLVGEGSIGSRRWVNFKAALRTFSVRYGQWLALTKAKEEESLEELELESVAGGDSVGARLAREALARLAFERYKGSIVRARLNRVSDEASNVKRSEKEQEARLYNDRYIPSITTKDGRLLKGPREVCNGFREFFADLFSAEDLTVSNFDSYLAGSPCLDEATAASCEGVVTEEEVKIAMSQVSNSTSPGLDGLPYEIYKSLSHLFIPILTQLYNHWFTLGHIPSQVTKGVITLLKKKGTTGKGVGDYRPITLLNTDLKILTKILANRLRNVADDLIAPQQTYALRGRSIQSNLHLLREVIEGVLADDEAAIISLDQSKAFDRVDHRFLFKVLEKSGFQRDYLRWVRLLYQTPKTVIQINGKQSSPFPVTRSVRQGCPLSPLLYILSLEPLLRKLRDETTSPYLQGIVSTEGVRTTDSEYADDVTAYVSSIKDIEVVAETVDHFNRVTGAQINREKSHGLLLGKWRGGGVPLPSSFNWTDGPIKILGIWVGPDLQHDKNWLEVLAKVKAACRGWLNRRLSLRGRAEACFKHVFPLILYKLSVIPCSKEVITAFEQLLSLILWKKVRRVRANRATCHQRLIHGGLGMPSVQAHLDAARLAFLAKASNEDHETLWGQKVGALFPRLYTHPGVESRRRPRYESEFLRECRLALGRMPAFCDLSTPRRILYHRLVEGSANDNLEKRLGYWKPEIYCHWSWAPGAGYLDNSEFSLTWRVARNLCPLRDRDAKVDKEISDRCVRCLTEKESVEHAFFRCDNVRLLWRYVDQLIDRMAPDARIGIDVAYAIDNVMPPMPRRKHMMFLLLLAVTRKVIWTTRLNVIFDGESFTAQRLIIYLRHQLKVKIICDWERLSRREFYVRWTNDCRMLEWTRGRWKIDLPDPEPFLLFQ